MTTNLSMQRPEVIPRIRLDLYFDVDEWGALFPPAVMTYLLSKRADGTEVCPPLARAPHLRKLPKSADLPVLVGVRMSLSFPGLIQAIPTHLEDLGAVIRDEAPSSAPPIRRIWLSDGGLTSNFPIHFFDELLPDRPTFAFSLDDLPPARDEAAPAASGQVDSQGDEIEARISMSQKAVEGAFLPIHEVSGIGGFAGAILASAKDWQDQAQSVLPGQRQRIVRIKLKKSEGGLNLDMDPEVSAALMGFGRRAGEKVRTEFNFREHRWRRALVAYEQLEALSLSLRRTWPGYAEWYRENLASFEAYTGNFSERRRREMATRIDALVDGAKAMEPPLPPENFPRPTGHLRTAPEL